MIEYQYKFVTISTQGTTEEEKMLNELGSEGWRVIEAYQMEQFGDGRYVVGTRIITSESGYQKVRLLMQRESITD